MSKTKDIMSDDRAGADAVRNTDLSYCLPAKDQEMLFAAAYQDFSQNGSEGKTHGIYLDCLGNPTVGVGHLIMPKKGLGNSKTEEAYRQRYIALDLRDAKGNPMSNEEKYKQFNGILAAMKNNSFKTSSGFPKYISSPKVGTLSEAGVQAAFNQDYEYWYNRTKKRFPDLDKYPLSLQLSLTHCGFAGALGKIKDTGDFVDIANQVAKARSTKICSTKERQMAQLAAKQCKYLADCGLNPNNTSRDRMMAALNVKDPVFLQANGRNEQAQNGIEQDNIEGCNLRGSFAGKEYEVLFMAVMAMIAYDRGQRTGSGRA